MQSIFNQSACRFHKGVWWVSLPGSSLPIGGATRSLKGIRTSAEGSSLPIAIPPWLAIPTAVWRPINLPIRGRVGRRSPGLREYPSGMLGYGMLEKRLALLSDLSGHNGKCNDLVSGETGLPEGSVVCSGTLGRHRGVSVDTHIQLN